MIFLTVHDVADNAHSAAFPRASLHWAGIQPGIGNDYA